MACSSDAISRAPRAPQAEDMSSMVGRTYQCATIAAAAGGGAAAWRWADTCRQIALHSSGASKCANMELGSVGVPNSGVGLRSHAESSSSVRPAPGSFEFEGIPEVAALRFLPSVSHRPAPGCVDAPAKAMLLAVAWTDTRASVPSADHKTAITPAWRQFRTVFHDVCCDSHCIRGPLSDERAPAGCRGGRNHRMAGRHRDPATPEHDQSCCIDLLSAIRSTWK